MKASRRLPLVSILIWVNFLALASAFSTPTPPAVTLPEHIVEAQLKCLGGKDIQQAYEGFFSQITDSTWEEFEKELEDESFTALTNHQSATVVMVTQLGEEECACLVRIALKSRAFPIEYWWALSKEDGKWKVDTIMPEHDNMDPHTMDMMEDGIYIVDEFGNPIEDDEDDNDGGWLGRS